MTHKLIPKASSEQAAPTITTPTIPNHTINPLAFYRIWQILGNKYATPPIEPLLPISRSSFYDGISRGVFPAPVKLSPRVSAWRGKDLLELLESLS